MLSLDAYIMGGEIHLYRKDTSCVECGEEWEERMHSEYGKTYYVDEDNAGICPRCGHHNYTGNN